MASTSTPSSSFLYYPSDDPANEVDEATDPKAEKLKNKPLSKDRLYVGNLHPTVDEYTLLTIFSKYGTIKSMDYLFHKTGPSRGKPRGFAFVEFADQSSAMSTLSALHDKLLRGRKLVVTFAHQATLPTTHAPGGKKRGADATKPTTLSLLKTGRGDG
ncbi:RNA-binding domain-containing protein [Athelia psychrophila]|uniref:Probable RNA-binding protein 18 n=1 Tax=Athelia psychrophila TaxID=1759441 RepID=A0A165WD85_9AGAM|nr:RNA-binding domain-containing protein [Fibularhizoctonia sp. CBS 109695]